MANLLYKEEVYEIVGAAMEVYNSLGSGFLEAVYQEALEFELRTRRIPFVAQHEIPIMYKGNPLKKSYRADFLVYGKIVVEIKAITDIGRNEDAQLLNYLKATGLQAGVLLNFGRFPDLQWKRMVLTTKPTSDSMRKDAPAYTLDISDD